MIPGRSVGTGCSLGRRRHSARATGHLGHAQPGRWRLKERGIAYSEAHLGGRLIEDPEEMRKLDVRYDLIRAKALSQEQSLELITGVRERMR
ncbi:Scr1 family TA system antitoxin-like transcriptional regulator [Actinomadura sp. 6N118]|uniref:Scr1 family TA system antitoxin-like transcriptional regulator n=1 Tax=Actinomadura sp. 6N118 TaxID=3375151 RepID=UPI003790AB50